MQFVLSVKIAAEQNDIWFKYQPAAGRHTAFFPVNVFLKCNYYYCAVVKKTTKTCLQLMTATVTWAHGILNTTFNQRHRGKPFTSKQGVSP